MRALIVSTLLLVASPLHALDVLAPRADGLVLGDAVTVEVRSATPPSLSLDGIAVTTTWTRLAYAERWVARVPSGAPGQHALAFAATGGTTVVHFQTTKGGSVAIADQVAKHFLAAHPTTGLGWDWGPGVFLHGLHELAEVSPQRAQHLAAISDYYAHHLAKGVPKIDHPDPCTPAIAALALARRDGITSALPAAKKVADYIKNEPRDAIGAIDHLGAHSTLRSLALASGIFAPWARSIWVDSLMMYGVFSTQWGNATHDPSLLDFGAKQPVIFASLLQDPITGLFEHAWDVKKARPLGVRWLRGNGWVGASTLEILDELPQGDARRAPLERIYRELAAGFVAKQMPDGLWDTVVDQPGTGYPETSGSALAAFALARGARRGLAPAGSLERARRAFEAIVARLARQPDGFSVTGISGATNPFPAWMYPLIGTGDDKDYGVGAFFLLASELDGQTW